MAYIEVNHKVLREVSEAISTYCSSQDREMQIADSEIKSMLSLDWIGQDAQEFGKKWEDVDARDSTAIEFRELLQDFGEQLRLCANEYQSAQEKAYNAACLLPKCLLW